MNNYKANPYFEIREESIKTVDKNIIVPRKALINDETNEVVAVVGENYNLIKNADIIKELEEYLNDSGIKFTRLTDFVSGQKGQKFTAKYKFPKIEANFGTHKTPYGNNIPDNVQLMLEVHNAYGQGSWGFDLGGYQLKCFNGLRVFEKMFQFRSMHTGANDITEYSNQLLISFAAAKELFETKLVKSWKALTEIDFEKIKVATVVKTLNLSASYQKTLDAVFEEKLKHGNMKTMWHAYSMFTWFTTHIVEQRNLELARSISARSLELLSAS